MTSHEKAMHLIEGLGISAKKTAEIIGKSQNTVYYKIKQQKSNKFLDEDYLKLRKHCKTVIKKSPE